MRVKKGDPQGLKPAFLAALGGTTEVVPFPKPFLGNQFSSNYFFTGFFLAVPKLVSMLAPMLANMSFAG